MMRFHLQKKRRTRKVPCCSPIDFTMGACCAKQNDATV
ncbi:hypothetical protein B566_EDAN015275, partial [Ephemera danica]